VYFEIARSQIGADDEVDPGSQVEVRAISDRPIDRVLAEGLAMFSAARERASESLQRIVELAERAI
jgi:hypothetical protein